MCGYSPWPTGIPLIIFQLLYGVETSVYLAQAAVAFDPLNWFGRKTGGGVDVVSPQLKLLFQREMTLLIFSKDFLNFTFEIQQFIYSKRYPNSQGETGAGEFSTGAGGCSSPQHTISLLRSCNGEENNAIERTRNYFKFTKRVLMNLPQMNIVECHWISFFSYSNSGWATCMFQHSYKRPFRRCEGDIHFPLE